MCLDWKSDEPPSNMHDVRAAASPLALKLKWTTLFSHRFLAGKHVNLLELESLIGLLRRITRAGIRAKRLLVLEDSRGCGEPSQKDARAFLFFLFFSCFFPFLSFFKYFFSFFPFFQNFLHFSDFSKKNFFLLFTVYSLLFTLQIFTCFSHFFKKKKTCFFGFSFFLFLHFLLLPSPFRSSFFHFPFFSFFFLCFLFLSFSFFFFFSYSCSRSYFYFSSSHSDSYSCSLLLFPPPPFLFFKLLTFHFCYISPFSYFSYFSSVCLCTVQFFFSFCFVLFGNIYVFFLLVTFYVCHYLFLV